MTIRSVGEDAVDFGAVIFKRSFPSKLGSLNLNPCRSLAVSPRTDKPLLLVGTQDATALLIDVDIALKTCHRSLVDNDPVIAQFGQAEDHLMILRSDLGQNDEGKMTPNSPRSRTMLGLDGPVQSVAFTAPTAAPSNQAFVLATENNSIFVVDAETTEIVLNTDVEQTVRTHVVRFKYSFASDMRLGCISALDFSPDGARIAISVGNTLIVVEANPESPSRIAFRRDHPWKVNAAAFSPPKPGRPEGMFLVTVGSRTSISPNGVNWLKPALIDRSVAWSAGKSLGWNPGTWGSVWRTLPSRTRRPSPMR